MKTCACLAFVLLAACSKPNPNPDQNGQKSDTPIEITAIELHKAFAADAAKAQKRFAGQPLLITGEVKNAEAPFTGYTNSGPVNVPAKVYFKTEVDYLPHDIKYVVCDGHFEDPTQGIPAKLDRRIKVGQSLTVRCDSARITWTDPGLYISDCSLPPPPPVGAESNAKPLAPIGVAKMEEDGTLILTLHARDEHGLHGEGRLKYAPTDREYQSVLDHLGPIKKGETVDVPPWPDKQ